MTEKQLEVNGAYLECNETHCKVVLQTGLGNFTINNVPRLKAVAMLQSAFVQGFEAKFEEEPEKDPYYLQNLKAELAAAENNLKSRRAVVEEEAGHKLEGTIDDNYGVHHPQSMRANMAMHEAYGLEWGIEDMKKEIEELESNE